jgi:hypothetical protein
MAGRNGSGSHSSFNNKTKTGQKNFLEGRRKDLGDDLLKHIDRAWITSITTCMTHEEMKSILIHVYSELRPDALTLEVLTNELLHDVNVTKTNGLRFKDDD